MEQIKCEGLPEGWESRTVKECLDEKSYSVGRVQTKEYRSTGKFPIIDQSQKAIAGYCDRDDLAYDGKLPVLVYGDHTNSVKYVDFPFVSGADGTKVLNARKGISEKYFFHVIGAFKPETQGYRRHFPILKDVRIPLPPLPEQERIVAKLDGIFEHVDSSIRLLEQNLADIDAMEASVLDEAFNREALPERWPMRRLEDLSECLDYLRRPVKHTDRVAGKYPYYGASGVVDYVDKFIFSEKLILLGEDGAKWGAGDNSAFIADGEYWVNNHAHIIRPNRSIIKDEYLVHFLVHADLKDYITGTTVPKLNQEKMRSILIPLPPLPEQERIVAKLDAFFSEQKAAKAKYESQIAELRALKSSILSSAFRGEI